MTATIPIREHGDDRMKLAIELIASLPPVSDDKINTIRLRLVNNTALAALERNEP